MKYIGSQTIETERLILKAQSMNEQKRLWQILMIPEVNKYFLTVPPKFRDKLLDWNKQEEFYKKEMEHAHDFDVFRWSVFLKETGVCIGRVSCHEGHDEDENVTDPNIRGVGWLIDPFYQGKGYATEAARAMIDYMFTKVDISEIRTGAAIVNPASWLIMEKLGFKRNDYTNMVQYTFLDELVEDYSYTLTKEDYFKMKKAKEKVLKEI